MHKVPPSEIANRLAVFQSLLVRNEIDVAIVRQNADLYYFTGTVQDAHLIVPAEGAPCFLVRRHVTRAEEQSPIRPIVPLNSIRQLPDLVFECCGTQDIKRIGMELDVIPAATFFFYDERLFPQQPIVDVGALVRRTRMIKSDWEIGMMREAAAISRRVAEAVPGLIKENMGETELTIELERVARKAGHLGFSRVRTFNLEIFFGHVLSGPEAATPSYCDSPTGGPGLSPAFGQGAGSRKICRGDVISVDTMMNHHGYLNDQTRNFALGEPPARLQELYRFGRQLHGWVRENARPGMVSGVLYEAILDQVRQAGHAQYFMGTGESRVSFVGHGLGLEVDELPFVAKGQRTPLQAGMTFALEPKWIVPGLGVVGLENTYLVTESGLESLNTAAEELIIT